jgi:uncharacterized protein involved in outer membrane biogenesis
MKKIALILAVVLLIGCAGVAIAIATFDVTRFLPAVVRHLETALGSRVELKDISLVWDGGIALALKGFASYDSDNKTGEPDLSFEEAHAVLKLLPLLRKNVRLASISIQKPRLQMVKEKTGETRIRGIDPHKEKKDEAKKANGAMLGASFFIKSLRISDGFLRYQDTTAESPYDISVRHFNLALRNVSLGKPVSFESDMAIFGERKDISLKGVISGITQSAPLLENFTADIDFGAIEYKELIRAVPALKEAGLSEGIAGKLSMRIDKAELRQGELVNLKADVSLKNGRLAFQQLASPIRDIQLDASAHGQDVTVRDFSAQLGGASLKGTADITDMNTRQALTTQFSCNVPELQSFIQSITGKKSNINGTVYLSFNGTARGLTWPQISHTLSGSGEFEFQKGVILDTNIVREVLDKISVIPVLGSGIKENLPQSIQAKLEQDYTLLSPIKKPFVVQDGIMAFNALKVATDGLDIETDARVRLSGSVEGRGVLRFSRDLSAALVAGAQSLSYITSADGLVEFPATYSISNGRIAFLPDMDYIVQRLMVSKGQELLSGILKRTNGTEAAAEGQAAPGSTSPSIEDFFGDLLNKQNSN